MDESLRRIFEFHEMGQAKAGHIASTLDQVFSHFLKTPPARNLENRDGFRGQDGAVRLDLDHHVSTLREAKGEFDESSEMVIDVFAEGRITVLSQRRDRQSNGIVEPTVKTLYFRPDEASESVAARVMSAIADSRENEIADKFSSYLRSTRENPSPSPNE